MTPADIDRVFGRGRLRMVTGDHVEVFREQALPGERRRYTKRFLATPAGDFREWTEREWRILARLVGHGIKPVPDVVLFDRGAFDRPALVQTYDAGVTVNHWATLLPLERDGTLLRNVFEDCAHWWALARHSLVALDAIHELRLVHLDLKADNICIPVGPAEFDPLAGQRSLHPRFDDITLIDFAFSLVSGEPLVSALPIAAQPDYEYQSPRLLRALEAGREGDLAPTRQLDWRCDFFSLAAMLARYLPDLDLVADRAWTRPRHARACAFVRRLTEVHDAELAATRPHAELIASACESLAQPDLRLSLQRGWSLAIDSAAAASAAPTPITRIALPLRTPVAPTVAPDAASRHPAPLVSLPPAFEAAAISVEKSDVDMKASARRQRERQRQRTWWWTAGLVTTAAASVPLLGPAWTALRDSDAARALKIAKVDATATKAPLPAPRRPAAARPTPAEVAPVVASTPATPPVTVSPAPPPVAVMGDPIPSERAAEQSPPVATSMPMPAPASRGSRNRLELEGGRLRASAPLPFADARPATGVASARSSVQRSRGGVAGTGRGTAGGSGARLASARGAGTHAQSRPLADALAFPSRQTILAAAQVRARAQLAAQAQPRETSTTQAQVPVRARGADTAFAWAVAGKPPPQAAATDPPARAAAAEVAGAPPAATSPLKTLPAPASTTAAAAPLLISAPVAAPTREVSALVAEPVAIDFAARADDVMTNHVPRLSQRAERLVSRVLFVAGHSANIVGDSEVLDSAAAVGRPADGLPAMTLSSHDAQLFNESARNEYAHRGATPQALLLQVRAFGANPLDPDGAAYLAFLLLRQRPAQPEAARQLALYALSLHTPRFPQGRVEDWATLAVASALSGRDRDARNAMLVSLAVAPNLERQCRAAIDAYAMYGERLRAPVEAMLYSAHASGRAQPASFCEWPPHWTVSGAMR